MAIGIIRNYELFKNWYKKLPSNNDINIIDPKDLRWPVEKIRGRYEINNFRNDECTIDPANCIEGDKLIALYYSMDYDGDDSKYFDVELDEFPTRIITILEGMHEQNGIINVDYSFGGGFNG